MVYNKGIELLAFFSKFQSSFLQNFARETARYTVVYCFEANLVSNHLLFSSKGILFLQHRSLSSAVFIRRKVPIHN